MQSDTFNQYEFSNHHTIVKVSKSVVTKSEFLFKNYLKYFVETVSEMLAMILGLKGGNRL